MAKILGVLGGMGPAAAAEFLRLLALHTPASKDQDHIITYMVGDPTIPDRTKFIMGGSDNPTLKIKQNLDKLVELGAEILAIPCNTAHFFVDKMELKIPLIHIIKETIKATLELNSCAFLISTLGTKQSGLFERHSKDLGLEILTPDETVSDLVQESINFIKANDMKKGGERIKKAILSLWEKENLPVILGCTELPLAYAQSGLESKNVVSSLEALAKACVKACKY